MCSLRVLAPVFFLFHITALRWMDASWLLCQSVWFAVLCACFVRSQVGGGAEQTWPMTYNRIAVVLGASDVFCCVVVEEVVLCFVRIVCCHSKKSSWSIDAFIFFFKRNTVLVCTA